LTAEFDRVRHSANSLADSETARKTHVKSASRGTRSIGNWDSDGFRACPAATGPAEVAWCVESAAPLIGRSALDGHWMTVHT
jgi:hypothetical protein